MSMNSPRVILASTSPRRRELLGMAGLEFVVVASDFEEDMSLDLSPRDLAVTLSLGKAWEVAERLGVGEREGAIIIGSDTFIADGDVRLGKPHTAERAREMLVSLSGRAHSVFSGFALIDSEGRRTVSGAVETKVFFRDLSDRDIEDYIQTGEPLDRAGAYAIQGLGRGLVERIEGDYATVIGLPIAEVCRCLADFGVAVPKVPRLEF